MAIVDITQQHDSGPQRYACDNCGRMIGALEQPYQWGEHVVCPECCARLQQQQPPSESPEEIEHPQEDSVLFRHRRISVKRSGIYDRIGRYPIDIVFSVHTRESFCFGVKVEVFDLARASTTYRLPNRDVAAKFISAIQKAKGSPIVVEKDDTGWFIIWW